MCYTFSTNSGIFIVHMKIIVRALIVVLLLPILACSVHSNPVTKHRNSITKSNSIVVDTSVDDKPNIIIILADDLGYGDLGFTGGIPETPNIDSIADDGVFFSQAYTPSSVCSPTRAGLLTGIHPARMGIDVVDPYYRSDGLPLQYKILPEYLEESGYVSGIVGKWHLGRKPDRRSLFRGFDYCSFCLHLDILSDSTKGGVSTELALWGVHKTDEITNNAINFVQINSNKPFFLYLSYTAPHEPLMASEDLIQKYRGAAKDENQATYWAMIDVLDQSVGMILKTLEEEGIEDNTIVIFLSDNGGLVNRGEKDWASNGNLRGGKHDHYDGGIRTPLIIKWPRLLPVSMNYPHTTSALDIVPTVLNTTRDAFVEDLDGTNLLPYLLGKTNGIPHETLYWRSYGMRRFAIRHGDYKLMQIKERVMLYDLRSDPYEQYNIIEKKPFVAKDLGDKFNEWQASMSDVPILIRKNKLTNDWYVSPGTLKSIRLIFRERVNNMVFDLD